MNMEKVKRLGFTHHTEMCDDLFRKGWWYIIRRNCIIEYWIL